MSIAAMKRVWNSKATGTRRLMLLAIADHEGDDRPAWPGVTKLARKCGITPRHAMRLLKSLEDSGELVIDRKPGMSNNYQVMVGRGPDEPVTQKSPVTPMSPVTSESVTRDTSVTSPVTPVSPKPSVNHQEAERAGAVRPPHSLSDEWRAWAMSQRPELDVDRLHQKFADHYANKPRRLNSLATWKEWVQTERAPDPATTRSMTVPSKPTPMLPVRKLTQEDREASQPAIEELRRLSRSMRAAPRRAGLRPRRGQS
ncbi:MAG: hypothetical protein Q8R33_18595 [Burkholderiales bacterium]|nr:hypothetical protein [Burkholderiales bacterium]